MSYINPLTPFPPGPFSRQPNEVQHLSVKVDVESLMTNGE